MGVVTAAELAAFLPPERLHSRQEILAWPSPVPAVVASGSEPGRAGHRSTRACTAAAPNRSPRPVPGPLQARHAGQGHSGDGRRRCQGAKVTGAGPGPAADSAARAAHRSGHPHDHGRFPLLGGCIPNPKQLARPALRPAGWSSNGPPSFNQPARMITRPPPSPLRPGQTGDTGAPEPALQHQPRQCGLPLQQPCIVSAKRQAACNSCKPLARTPAARANRCIS